MALLQDDLIAIRKSRGLTPANIFERTRIPLSIIDEIERGTIFTNRNHQTTYIRSYVRSYAKALNIAEEHIIEALDQQQADGYSGLLSKVYLGETAAAKTKAPETEPVTKIPKSDVPETTSNQPSGSSTVTKGGNEYSRPDPKREYNQTTPPPPEMESVDWAVVGRKAAGSGNKTMVYIGLTLAVVLVFGLIYYLLLFSPVDSEILEAPQEQPTTVVDDEAEDFDLTPEPETTPSVAPIPPPATTTTPSAPVRPATTPVVTGTLPDTIKIVLHASTGKLEPVRVTSDVNNVRSPYWIEASEAMRFEFIDNISIEGQISRMALWINGHHFSDLMEYSSGGRMIELSREALRQYSELFAQPGDETSQLIDAPAVINDRPLF